MEEAFSTLTRVTYNNAPSLGGHGRRDSILFKRKMFISSNLRFVALYPDQMKKVSRQEFEGLIEEYSDHILPSVRPEYSRVSRVSNRILNGNKDLRQIYDKTWTVTVVDQPVQNAFVLPSGNIFIFRGMLDLCENDDQLAVIIGHEMAHSINQKPRVRM